MKIIAEISCSHNGSLDRAIETIKLLNCDAVKFQTWSPDKMAVPYKIKKGAWKGMDLMDLYKQAFTPWWWFERLFDEVRERGMTPFSTPFDKESVDFLETLDCPMYKISSFELVDLELIDYVSQTRKPIIISTGAASKDEILEAVKTAYRRSSDVTLLHCVSEYPTTLENSNLGNIDWLYSIFPKCQAVGISDHSAGPYVAIAATAMGVSIIEKHVTLTHDGLDKNFAMLPEEFNDMVERCRLIEKSLKTVSFNGYHELRRSLYYNKDLKKGETITKSDIKTARPNKGLNPLCLEEIIGTKLNHSVKENEPVQI